MQQQTDVHCAKKDLEDQSNQHDTAIARSASQTNAAS